MASTARDLLHGSQARRPRLAVIGGGINGAGIAWELARKDYDVTLFEKGAFGSKTSSATTKMIHGGLRYLEQLHVALVRESLRERRWLLENAPGLVKPMEILLPIYADSPRSRVLIRTGLTLYDLLAGRDNIANHRSLSAAGITQQMPLRSEGLRGGFAYWDAQVDDHRLVLAVIEAARRDGAVATEFTPIDHLEPEGSGWRIRSGDRVERFDFVVNAVGPWMNEFLGRNRIETRYRLSLVRGSHLVLRHQVAACGALLQSTTDSRIFFVLPWKGGTLVGTTEVVQHEGADDTHPSDEEIDYLLARFNHYFRDPIGRDDIAEVFAGARPLVGRADDPGAIGREYRVLRSGNLINVFGGKMTTFMALARRVSMRVDNYFGQARTARPAVFSASPREKSNEQ